jgi:hypothetical protein
MLSSGSSMATCCLRLQCCFHTLSSLLSADCPIFDSMKCELLSVWRAGLGYCLTSEESCFNSWQGKSSKVPRRAVGTTQPPADNWSSLPRGKPTSTTHPHLVTSLRIGGAVPLPSVCAFMAWIDAATLLVLIV